MSEQENERDGGEADLQKEQEGKGYGEDEGERDEALEREDTDGP
jgi:hypothetical protein